MKQWGRGDFSPTGSTREKLTSKPLWLLIWSLFWKTLDRRLKLFTWLSREAALDFLPLECLCTATPSKSVKERVASFGKREATVLCDIITEMISQCSCHDLSIWSKLWGLSHTLGEEIYTGITREFISLRVVSKSAFPANPGRNLEYSPQAHVFSAPSTAWDTHLGSCDAFRR